MALAEYCWITKEVDVASVNQQPNTKEQNKLGTKPEGAKQMFDYSSLTSQWSKYQGINEC
jgi:hypothetical protein